MDVRERRPPGAVKGHWECFQGPCIFRHSVFVETKRVARGSGLQRGAARCATRRGPCSLQDVKHGVAAQVGCLTPQGPERHDPEYVGEGQPGANTKKLNVREPADGAPTEPISPRIMSRGIYRAKIATENVGSVTNELSLFTLTLGLERRAQHASPMQNLKLKTLCLGIDGYDRRPQSRSKSAWDAKQNK